MNAPVTSIALIALLAAVLDACASSPPRTLSFPDSQLGRYRYLQVVPSTSPQKTLEGTIIIERDTLTVEDNSGLCRYDRNSGSVAIVYHCGDVTYRFDRKDPINRADYGVTMLTYVAVTRCVQYTTNSEGQRVCSRTDQSTEERRVGRSGRLKPVREG